MPRREFGVMLGDEDLFQCLVRDTIAGDDVLGLFTVMVVDKTRKAVFNGRMIWFGSLNIGVGRERTKYQDTTPRTQISPRAGVEIAIWIQDRRD